MCAPACALVGDIRERLGSKADDIAAIKTHQWFAGFDWGGVQAGEYFNQVIRLIARNLMVHRFRPRAYFFSLLVWLVHVWSTLCCSCDAERAIMCSVAPFGVGFWGERVWWCLWRAVGCFVLIGWVLSAPLVVLLYFVVLLTRFVATHESTFA